MKAIILLSAIKRLSLTLLLAAALVESLTASPKNPGPLPVEKQLAAYLTYPAFIQDFTAGILVISFRVNSEHKIADVQVYSDNQQLNSFIVHSLLYKPLQSGSLPSSNIQVVRIRFRSNENN